MKTPRSARNRLSKPFGIERATVSFAATGETYVHPELYLQTSDGETLIKVRFQTHRLDRPDVAGGAHSKTRPSDRFDFGFPYGACYAARWQEGRSYGWGSLQAQPSRSEGDDLRKLARFHDLIARTVSEYNLARVEPDCELALWVAVLEKLGVPLTIRRWVGRGGQELDSYGWRQTLPEDQRHPARDLIDAANPLPSAIASAERAP